MLDFSKINKTAGKGNSVAAKQAAYKRQLAKNTSGDTGGKQQTFVPGKPVVGEKKQRFEPSGPR